MRHLTFILFIFFIANTNLTAAEPWQNRVYLASFPRSGNHWVRYLLEEATNIVTSSVYSEHDEYTEEHRFNQTPKEMPWGAYCYPKGYRRLCRLPRVHEPFVVKTHFPIIAKAPFDLLKHTLIIRVVRHPVDTIYSHYSKHNPNAEYIIPQRDLLDLMQEWRKFNEFWSRQANVYTVRYEDLLENPYFYLNEILIKAGYSIDPSNVSRAISVFPPKGSPLKHLPHFTKEQRDTMKLYLENLLEEFDYEL